MRSQKIVNSDPKRCFIRQKHPQKRVPLFYFCEKVQSLVQYLIKILKSSGFLNFGHNIETFLFQNYNFNSIENLSLVSLWNYVYKLKFNTEKYAEIQFCGYLKQVICQLALLSPNLKLESQAVLNVIEVVQGAAANKYMRRDYNNI